MGLFGKKKESASRLKSVQRSATALIDVLRSGQENEVIAALTGRISCVCGREFEIGEGMNWEGEVFGKKMDKVLHSVNCPACKHPVFSIAENGVVLIARDKNEPEI